MICKSKYDSIHDVLNDRNLDDKNLLVSFDRFVSMSDDGWYQEAPPFNMVLGDYDGEPVVFKFDDLEFSLQSLDSS